VSHLIHRGNSPYTNVFLQNSPSLREVRGAGLNDRLTEQGLTPGILPSHKPFTTHVARPSPRKSIEREREGKPHLTPWMSAM